MLWGISIPRGVTPLVGNSRDFKCMWLSPHDMLPCLLLASLTAWTLVSPESHLDLSSCLVSVGLWAWCPHWEAFPRQLSCHHYFCSFSRTLSDLSVSLFAIKDLILFRIPDLHNSLHICRYPNQALPKRSVWCYLHAGGPNSHPASFFWCSPNMSGGMSSHIWEMTWLAASKHFNGCTRSMHAVFGAIDLPQVSIHRTLRFLPYIPASAHCGLIIISLKMRNAM